MFRLTLILFLSFYLSFVYAQEFDTAYGEAEIVLIEYDPWLMVIGSDTPTFVLYKNGCVIYKDTKAGKIYSVKLTPEEKAQLLDTLELSDSLMSLPNYISTSGSTDQPDNLLVFNYDSVKQINVYGSIRENYDDRKNTPLCFLKVFDAIINYKNEKAKEWLPAKIEVLVWNYSNSPVEPVKWPEEWPDLNSKETAINEGPISIYLESIYYRELLELIKALGEKQAVEINGKKFSVSYRLPFPNI